MEGHRYAGPAHLLGQRLGEGEDEGLGGIVDGHERPRLEACGGSHVQDPAPAPSQHVGQEASGQFSERHHVHLNHVQLALHGELGRGAQGPEAGVVDQDVHTPPVGIDDLVDSPRRRRVGQIFGEDVAGYAVAFPEIRGHGLQGLFASRQEYEVRPVGCEEMGQIPADSH